jgi:hypothetical protein
MDGKPSATEAFQLMVRYYQAHPYRGAVHLLLAALTGGVWTVWFVAFWFGTLVGWMDVDGMRALP